MVELYAPAQLAKLDRRRKRTKRLLWILALAALAVCVVLTSRANTRNLYQMLQSCILVSVAAGWIILYFGVFTVRDAGRELDHAAHLADEPREVWEGKVTILRKKARIRGSITVRLLEVDTGERVKQLSVHIDKADQLRRAGDRLRLWVSHGYVVAYEVI